MLSREAARNQANVQEKQIFGVDQIPNAAGEPHSVLPHKYPPFSLAA